MSRVRDKKSKRGGSKPRGDVAATARVELVMTPDEKERWQAAAAQRETSISNLIREAVDIHLDRLSQEEGALADLGRRVVDLVAEHAKR